MKLNRKLVLVLSLVLSLALATGSTLAYLSDTDADVNVMTLGNVDIDQFKMERVVNENGEFVTLDTSAVDPNYGYNTAYKLQPFTQGKPAYPAVYTNEAGTTAWDEFQQLWNQVGAPGSNDLFDDSMKNVIDKFVFVRNTGKSDAYYRTIIAIEAPEGLQNGVIHTNFNATNRFDYNPDKEGVQNASDSNKFYTTIEGVNYLVYTVTYQEILTPSEVSRPSLLQLYLDPKANNEDVALFGETWDVLVVTQAIQAAGFDNAQAALEVGFGKITAESHPWLDMDGIEEGDQDPDFTATEVATADDLIEALENNEDVVLTADIKIDPANMSNAYGTTGISIKNGQTLDGAGHTIDIQGAGGTWDSGINTTGGLIKDLTVTGSFRGIFINHNSTHSEPVVLENVTLDGTVYTVSCDQGLNQTLIATNSTFKGWTSYAATLGSASFTNCYFGEGSGYAYCRPYAPTTFVRCEFEEGFTVDPRAAVTFEDCTIGGVALTAENLGTLVSASRIANATVK